MKQKDVQIGGTYVAKVSGQLAEVRIDAVNPHGGWNATNIATGRTVRIKSAQRLRRTVADAAPPPPDPNRCATVGCDGTSVLEYLGRPRCQTCWDEECANEETAKAADAAEATNPANGGEETDMTTKSKKSSTKPAKPSKNPKVRKAKAEVKPAVDSKPKRVSALDAAAEILKRKRQAMHCPEIITAMADAGLWSSPNGKTPAATLYAAILREINAKGKDARFAKVERGKFELAS